MAFVRALTMGLLSATALFTGAAVAQADTAPPTASTTAEPTPTSADSGWCYRGKCTEIAGAYF